MCNISLFFRGYPATPGEGLLGRGLHGSGRGGRETHFPLSPFWILCPYMHYLLSGSTRQVSRWVVSSAARAAEMHRCPVLPFTSFTHLCACPRVGGKWSLTLGFAQSELFLCPAAGHPLQSPAEMQNLGPNAALQSTAACQ